MHTLRSTCSWIIAGLLVLASAGGFKPAMSQKEGALAPCQVGRNAAGIGFWTWPAAARVKVYVLKKDFREGEIPALLLPLQAWNSVTDMTGSGVKFEYVGMTAKPLTCESCLTIMRGEVFDKRKRHITETRAYSVHRDQLITYAAIVIDPSLTNLSALANAVNHELGHNLGLLDCYGCKKNSTLMTGFKAVNVPNALDRPSNCDIAQVRQAYLELKVRIRRSPVAKVDEGEEPVDDDTPIIVPKP